LFIHVGGHQHDVHDSLMNNFANDIEKLGKVAIAELAARPEFRRKPSGPFAAPGQIRTGSRGAHAKRHVRVFRVRQDEGARRRIGFDFGEFGVERFHGQSTKSEGRDPKEIRMPKPEWPSTLRSPLKSGRGGFSFASPSRKAIVSSVASSPHIQNADSEPR